MGDAHGAVGARRPRGRRADGEDTRARILDAARAEFLERGYAAASLRAVARRAEVDPALVRYWFEDGKPQLFVGSLLDSGINPARIAEAVAAGPVESMATRMVTAILAAWETPGASDSLQLLVRGLTSGHDLPGSVREFLMAEVFARVRPRFDGPDAALRVNLAMSSVVGLMLARYVVRLEPLASMPAEDVVRHVAPVIQRYITPGTLDPLPQPGAEG